jgi:regulator of cell morphogenesis and NO signaling
MTTIDPQVTLGDLVTAHPGLARDLERLGLDYCCHGNRSLTDAATQAGLDPNEVVSTLGAVEAPGAPAEWTTLSLAELADHVQETHHKYLWDELPRLSQLVDKIAEVHGSRHPELAEVQRIYAQIRVAFEPHLRREELRDFPAIRHLDDRPDPELPQRLQALIDEHDEVGEMLEKLHEITGGYAVPDDGCNTYRMTYAGLAELQSDTHLHVHKENNVLFPGAIERLAVTTG